MEAPENTAQEKTPEPVMTPQRKWLMFAGGFLGWYTVTGLGWLIIMEGNFSYGWGGTFGIPNLCVVPGSLIALLVFALIRKTRLVALGLLAALAFNFLVSLILGMSNNAMCFVPFFIPE